MANFDNKKNSAATDDNKHSSILKPIFNKQ